MKKISYYHNFSKSKFSKLTNQERFEMLNGLDEYIGKYVSNEWVRKNVLRQSDEEIEAIDKQIDSEDKAGELDTPDPDDPRWD